MRGLAKFILFLAVLYGLWYARDQMNRVGVREKSENFAITSVATITARWNKAELDRFADSNLVAQVAATGNRHALDFPYFARLGARTSDVACTLGEYTSYKDDTRNYLATNYACDALFERGNATILIGIARDKDNAPWRILYFDVTSPYLH